MDKEVIELPVKKRITTLFFFPFFLFAQENLDSLWGVWNDEQQDDIQRVRAMKRIAWDGYVFSKPDSAFYFAQMMYDFGKEREMKEAMGTALNIQGTSFALQSDYENSLEYFKRSLQISEDLKDQEGVAMVLNNMANIYESQGNLAKAIEFHTKSLQLEEQIGQDGLVSSYSNIGNIYSKQGDTDKAKAYHQKALVVAKKTNNKKGIALALTNMAGVLIKNEEFDQALEHLLESVEIEEEIKGTDGLSVSFNSIGEVYFLKGNYAKAIAYYTRSLQLSLQVGNKSRTANTLVNIGDVHYAQAEYQIGIDYGLRSMTIAKEIGHADMISKAAKFLWKSYKEIGKHQNALKMYEQHIEARDSILSEESKQELIRQEYKYEYEKKVVADSIKLMEATKIKDAELSAEKAKRKQKEQQSYFLSGILTLSLLFGGFIYNRFRLTRKQKAIIKEQKEQVDQAFDELGEKNREIVDSINYAKRIQSAILPQQQEIKQHLKDSFVLYRPKDIVSGDFYWIEPTENGVLFAAADCTGHGVPGAMVSVICTNALNKSVRVFGLRDPGEILDKAREIVIDEFKKGKYEMMDGMDIALCSLIGNSLTYSGANNPLWIIRNGVEEVEEIRADRQPVGQFYRPSPYTSHNLQLNAGDTLYIFSDGYVDQFGGERGKKFRAKALKELLISIQKETMEDQQQLINEAFANWKGDLDQIDDVCMIGFRKE